MTVTVLSLLQPLKDRLAAATPGPWTDALGKTFKAVGSIADARLIVNAPTDQAKLITAIEAVDSLADEFEKSSEGFGLDLQDDDFDRGWFGARREVVERIRAALTQALEGEAK